MISDTTGANLATSPLLSVEAAAVELHTEPTAVLRLIARRRLEAHQADDRWRITPKQLEAFVAAGSPDLEPRVWNPQTHWIQGDEAEHDAGWLKNSISGRMLALTPSKLPTPEIAMDNRGRYPGTVDLQPTDDIRSLLNERSGSKGTSRSSTQRESPYGTIGQCYAVARLRALVANALKSRPTEATVPSKSLAEQLYASSEEYNLLLSQAWGSFTAGEFFVLKQFPGAIPDRNAVSIRFQIKHRLLNWDFDRVAEIAF